MCLYMCVCVRFICVHAYGNRIYTVYKYAGMGPLVLLKGKIAAAAVRISIAYLGYLDIYLYT